MSVSFISNNTRISRTIWRTVVAGSVGYTIYDNLDDVSPDPDDVDKLRLSKNAFGFIGYAGWTFSSGYSIEFSYADFGEFEIKSEFGEEENTVYTNVTGGTTGMGIGAKYDWSYSESFDIYGRIGVMRWEATWDVENILPTGQVIKSESDTNGTEFYLGAGLQYEIAKNIFVYGEGYYLDSRFDQDGFNQKMPVYAAFGGVMMRFGSVGDRSSAKRSTGQEMTACDPKYKDISGLACK